MTVAAAIVWAKNHKTARIVVTSSLFYIIRSLLQNHFIMGRPDGYLWSYPGLPAITVNYNDTSDFYFSGHIGAATMYLIETYALGEKKLFYITLYVLINEWFFLSFTRSHYIIDLISGFIFPLLLHRVSEHITYLYDVGVIGARAKERDSFYYKPCNFCGWSNSDASK